MNTLLFLLCKVKEKQYSEWAEQRIEYKMEDKISNINDLYELEIDIRKTHELYDVKIMNWRRFE